MSATLAGKVAIVTGAAGGIGEAMARAFLDAGARVGLFDVSDRVSDLAAALGENALPGRADVSSEADVAAMIDTMVARFGRVDVLCNNAGIDGDTVSGAEMSSESFDRVIAVNLRSVFLGQRYAIPAMLRNDGLSRGAIVNTASVAGVVGLPGGTAYSAAKAGVIGITRVAAAEYSQAGIRVNAICPGVIQTPMVASLGIDHPALRGAIDATPAGRLGNPEEVASLALYLAGDGASYVMGAVLSVDGGFTAV